MCPYGRVQLLSSEDEGRTWENFSTLTSGPLDDRDAGIVELADGTLVVTWFTSIAYERGIAGENDPRHLVPVREAEEWKRILTEEEKAEWISLRDSMPDSCRQRELGCWSIRSEDGGRTWSSKVDTVVGNPHGPILLADGRLLLCGKFQAGDKLADGQKGSPFSVAIGAAESRDGGKTWQELSRIFPMPGHGSEGYHEAHAVEAADGRIVVHLRNHNAQNDGEIVQTESFDGGKTWAVPRSTGVWGFPAHLTRLSDGRLLSTFGHRKDPRGIRFIMSEDQGETWSEPFGLSSDGGKDFGYPSTIQTKNGEFLTLWYDRKEDGHAASSASLYLQRWRLEVA